MRTSRAQGRDALEPYDAKGLLIAAIEDDDPVIYFEPKRIYNGPFDGDPHKPAVPGPRTRKATFRKATSPSRSARLKSCAQEATSRSSPMAPWST